MSMTKRDVSEFFDLSLRYICQRVGAPEFGVIDPNDLLAGIARGNAQVYQATIAFLDAYRKWFDFSDELIRMGRPAISNSNDLTKLNRLVRERDLTRERLKQVISTLRNDSGP